MHDAASGTLDATMRDTADAALPWEDAAHEPFEGDASFEDAPEDAAAPPSSEDASTDASVAPVLDSEIAACKAMLGKYCLKAEQCGLIASADECLRFNLANCPDVLFSPGSARTVEQTRDCASRLPTMTCDEVLRTPRVCGAPAGTRAEGAACAFNSQCEAACTQNNGKACGQCVPWVAAGDACGGSQRLCDPMHVCEGGVCRARVPATNRPALCTEDRDCAANQLCDRASSTMDPFALRGTCAPRPSAGQPCTASGACGPNAYCKGDRTCAPLARIGEACATLSACGPSALCDANICRARRATVGQECTGGCVEGTTCAMVSGSVTLRCARLRAPGESCFDAVDLCPADTLCDGMVCKPNGNQGLFARACGMP